MGIGVLLGAPARERATTPRLDTATRLFSSFVVASVAVCGDVGFIEMTLGGDLWGRDIKMRHGGIVQRDTDTRS